LHKRSFSALMAGNSLSRIATATGCMFAI